MGALQHEVIRGPRQAPLETPRTLALVVGERPLQQRDVGQLEVVDRPLGLVGLVDVAVGDAGHPHEIEHVLHSLEIHGEPLGPVSQFHAGRIEVDAAYLLEVGELGALHPVDPHLPAQAPRPQRGRLPVVLDKADVVLGQVDAQVLQGRQVEFLDVVRTGLQDHLVLVVMAEPVRVFPIAPVGGADGRLHIGHPPGIGAQHPEKGRRVESPGSYLGMVRLPDDAALSCPILLQTQEYVLEGRLGLHSGTPLSGGFRTPLSGGW